MNKVWPAKKLGEIREEIKKEKAPPGIVPYIEIGNVDVESKNVSFTDKGAVKGSIFSPANSILISRVRPTRGAIFLLDKKVAVSSAFTIIKPKQSFNPKLLFYFLAWNKKFFAYLASRQKGTNYPSIRENDILDFKIAFPEDPAEQRKIVYILDSIRSAVKVQDKIIEKTKELKKSLMYKLFREGTRGAKLKKTEIGEIPENWEVVKLESALDLIIDHRGKTPKKLGGNWVPNGGIPVLSANNIHSGRFVNLKEVKFVTKELYKKWMPVKLEKGDVLLTSEAPLGEALYLEKQINYCLGQRLFALRAKRTILNPKFLYFILTSPIEHKEMIKRATGTTAKGIRQSELRAIPLILPPLPEQREIAEILQTVDQKIKIEQKKKAFYEELFKSMLNQLMTGKIRVNKLNF